MKYLCEILFLALSISLFSISLLQGQSDRRYVNLSSTEKDKVSIIWLNTSVGAQNKVTLKAKLFASFPIEARHIKLLINGEEEGSKADFGSLYGNAEHEFTYERDLNLPFVDNEFQLYFQKDSLQVLSSIIEIKNKKIRILDDNDFTSRILWTYPDPAKTEGLKFRSESSLFHFSVLIKTGIQINSKSSIEIVLNNGIRSPKTTDKLLKIGTNHYEYKGSILLNNSVENNLYLRLIVNEDKIDSKVYQISVDEDQPSLYLLSIGTLTNLEYTSKDAEDFSKIYQNQNEDLGIFRNINIDLLNGIDATTSEIKGRIEELKIKRQEGIIKDKDLIILFMSSHGFIHNGKLRIQGDDYDSSRKRTTSIEFKRDLMDILDEINCKKLVFIDACHSGAGEKFNVADLNYEIEKLNQIASGTTTFVSSQGDELSYEDSSWKNGAFTEAILQGLKEGKADADSNFIVTVNELSDFLKMQVPRMVMDKKGKPQNPKMLSNDLGDVAIYFIN